MTIEPTVVASLQPGVPTSVNPLLQRIQLPGETFKLPSCGVFYTNGELAPNVKDAEVHVHPMTVLDEIQLKTPDMLFSGRAVEEVFSRCIPEILKPRQLLAKDVDFLLLCLRKVSYGSTVELESIHSQCKKVPEGKKPERQVHHVEVNNFIKNTKRIDPTTVAKQFTVVLPNEQVVRMTPVRFDDFIALMQSMDKQQVTPEEQVATLTETLANIIVSVDEITNHDMIVEWLRAVKPAFLQTLNTQMEDTISWGPDFAYSFQCKDCGEAQSIIAPLNPLAFFT